MNTDTSNAEQKERVGCSALLALLPEIKEYIELTEVTMDGEWGSCRNLKELQRDGVMPEIYEKVCSILSANARGEPRSPTTEDVEKA